MEQGRGTQTMTKNPKLSWQEQLPSLVCVICDWSSNTWQVWLPFTRQTYATSLTCRSTGTSRASRVPPVNFGVRPRESSVRIGYLIDHPEFVAALAPAIWEHWREALPEDTSINHRIVKLQRHMQKSQLPIALVAYNNEEVIGTAALRSHDLEGRADLSPWLGGVFVMPAHRGKGAASMLCQAIKLHAASLSISSLYLFTQDQQQLYARLGWRPIEEATWRGKWGNIMLASTSV
ncbi:MAG: GNAT family N-acetyltransferase [Chitinophagaceae bacterium]|nr:MAG: GNAT family N-acetyltransferase [Chitinophagaceae bacterium]